VARFTWTRDSVVELHASSSVHPIHGEIRDLRGECDAEVSDGRVVGGGGGYIEAPVDALSSGKKLEDMALRKQIDAKRFPTIRYDVRSVSGGPEQFKVNGALTFHGITQEFVEECKASVEGGTLKIEAEHTFDIRDFGVQPFKILTLKVHPEVRLVVRMVGQEA
jgi:hypothetical protein